MQELEDATLDCIRNAGRILIGAAFADGDLEGIEEDTIFDLLIQAVGEEEDLPEDLQEIFDEFDPEKFDLDNVAEDLLEEPYEHRYHILLMVSQLQEIIHIDTGEEDDEDEESSAEGSYRQRVSAALEVELDILDGASPGFDDEADEEA